MLINYQIDHYLYSRKYLCEAGAIAEGLMIKSLNPRESEKLKVGKRG